MRTRLSGKAVRVLVGLDAHSLVTIPQPEVRVTFEGFAGDRHAGHTRLSDGRTPHYPRGTEIRNSRQVSIVSSEELAAIAAAMGIDAILPDWLGANVLVHGIPKLTHLPPSTRLFFASGAVLEVEGENVPCPAPGNIIQEHHLGLRALSQRFVKAANGQRGIVAWVEKPGLIREGDDVTADIPPQVMYEVNA